MPQWAEGAGVDTEQPFAFKIEGRVGALAYHILATPPDDNDGGSHKHHALNLELNNQNATLVGIYSTAHEGVFTHRNQYSHIHVLDEHGHTGHVDALEITAPIRISFPGQGQ